MPVNHNKHVRKNDAICLMHTYMFADSLVFEKTEVSRGGTRKTLRKSKVDPDDPDAVTEAYEQLVHKLAKVHLPPGWKETHDYWGGKCFAFEPGWDAPKGGTVMAGDSGRFLCAYNERSIEDALMRAGV